MEWSGNHQFPCLYPAHYKLKSTTRKVRTIQLAIQACLSNACNAAGDSPPSEGAEVCSSHWRGSVPDSPGPGGCCTPHCKPRHVRPNAMPIDAWQPMHPSYVDASVSSASCNLSMLLSKAEFASSDTWWHPVRECLCAVPAHVSPVPLTCSEHAITPSFLQHALITAVLELSNTYMRL